LDREVIFDHVELHRRGLLSYFTQYRYKIPGDLSCKRPVSPQAHLPAGPIHPGFPERIPLNLAFILAVIACILVYIFCGRRNGDMNCAPRAQSLGGRCGGVSIRKQIILAMGISGGQRAWSALTKCRLSTQLLRRLLCKLWVCRHRVSAARAQPSSGCFWPRSRFFCAANFVDAFTLHISKDIVDMLQGIVIILVALRPEAIFGGAIKVWIKEKAKV
jgi:ABC-type uncharacterized transport system permease subunit